MDSLIIETRGCPLDPDLLKSWEHFCLENSHSLISSDTSESTDRDETAIKQNALIQHLENLSIDDVLDSKYGSLKCSNKNTEVQTQKKNYYEKLIFVENKKKEKTQSSCFSLKNNDLLQFEVEADAKSLNKNCSTSFQKKTHNKQKFIVANSTEVKENRFSSSSVKTNNSLNNNYKSSSDASNEDESDDDELEESVTLRERYPNRNNRPENNKQQRTTPFPKKHLKTFKQQLHLNNFQAPVDYHDTPNDYYIPYHEYKHFNQNNTSSERYNSTFSPCFHHSDFLTDETLQDIASSMVSDQIINGVLPCSMTDNIMDEVLLPAAIDEISGGVIPCPVTDQITNGVIPCPVTDQIINGVIPCVVTDKIVNGVIPYTMAEEVFDSVVPSVDYSENVKEKCSVEINDVSYFDTLEGKTFSESSIKDCALRKIPNENIASFLDSHFETLTAEEVDYMLKDLTGTKSDRFPCQNNVDLIEDINIASTSEQMSYQNSNYHNLRTESDELQTSSSNTSETLFNSNLHKENNILENSGENYDHECFTNKSSNYSTMVSKNFTSINSECLSPETSNFTNVSEEIETIISRKHDILQLEEIMEWVMKGQKNVSELPPATDNNWNVLPFVDSESISECVNVSEYEILIKKRSHKNKRMNHKHKQTPKIEEPKIYRIWGTEFRDKLFHSASFCIRKWELEKEEMRQQIKNGVLGTEQKKIIHFLKKNRKTKYKGTNLHQAILLGNIEKVFCIVELHKECHGTTNEINLRDSSNKTVLDYSKEKGMDLLSGYLEENDAKECSACLIKVSCL